MSDASSDASRRGSSRASSPEKLHWAARVENVSNRHMGRLLRRFGWKVRLQPYHGYGSTTQVRILARLLYAAPSKPADYHDQPVHDMRTMAVRGWRNFFAQVAPDRTVHIELGGHTFTTRADRAGIVDEFLDVQLPPGDHEARMWTREDNAVSADVTVIDPATRIGVVSDIDDTVMVTWLPRPLLAFWNAFVVNQSTRRVVPGMPMLYQHITRTHPLIPFIYLSTGAWNVFPVLKRFLYKNGYPTGPLLLTDWGPTATAFFRSGPAHKRRSLRLLHEMFPQMQWILIGDDGQHDPQIYTDFALENPDAVHAIAIRQLTESEQMLAHGTPRPLAQSRGSAAADAPLVVPGKDGHALLEGLRDRGLLE